MRYILKLPKGISNFPFPYSELEDKVRKILKNRTVNENQQLEIAKVDENTMELISDEKLFNYEAKPYLSLNIQREKCILQLASDEITFDQTISQSISHCTDISDISDNVTETASLNPFPMQSKSLEIDQVNVEIVQLLTEEKEEEVVKELKVLPRPRLDEKDVQEDEDSVDLILSYERSLRNIPICAERFILLCCFESAVAFYRRDPSKRTKLLENLPTYFDSFLIRVEKEALRIESLDVLKIKISQGLTSLKKCSPESHDQIFECYEFLFQNFTLLLKAVRAVDIDCLAVLLQNTHASYESIKDKDILLLLGRTGVGKSTSIHFLCGSKLDKNTFLPVDGNEALGTKTFKVSSKTTSETRVVNCIDLQYGRDVFTLVDTPGFDDNRGCEVDIANGLGVAEAVRQANTVRPVIFVSKKNIGDRLDLFLRQITEPTVLFSDVDAALPSISYVFTKFSFQTATDGQMLYSQLYEKYEAAENVDNITKTMLEDLLSKIASRDQIPLHLDPSRDRSHAIEIFKEIISEPPINTPEEMFQNYTTRQSLNLLEEQIQLIRHSIDTIFSIDLEKLGKDEFQLLFYRVNQLSLLNHYLSLPFIQRAYEYCVGLVMKRGKRLVELTLRYLDSCALEGYSDIEQELTIVANAIKSLLQLQVLRDEYDLSVHVEEDDDENQEVAVERKAAEKLEQSFLQPIVDKLMSLSDLCEKSVIKAIEYHKNSMVVSRAHLDDFISFQLQFEKFSKGLFNHPRKLYCISQTFSKEYFHDLQTSFSDSEQFLSARRGRMKKKRAPGQFPLSQLQSLTNCYSSCETLMINSLVKDGIAAEFPALLRTHRIKTAIAAIVELKQIHSEATSLPLSKPVSEIFRALLTSFQNHMRTSFQQAADLLKSNVIFINLNNEQFDKLCIAAVYSYYLHNYRDFLSSQGIMALNNSQEEEALQTELVTFWPRFIASLKPKVQDFVNEVQQFLPNFMIEKVTESPLKLLSAELSQVFRLQTNEVLAGEFKEELSDLLEAIKKYLQTLKDDLLADLHLMQRDTWTMDVKVFISKLNQLQGLQHLRDLSFLSDSIFQYRECQDILHSLQLLFETILQHVREQTFDYQDPDAMMPHINSLKMFNQFGYMLFHHQKTLTQYDQEKRQLETRPSFIISSSLRGIISLKSWSGKKDNTPQHHTQIHDQLRNDQTIGVELSEHRRLCLICKKKIKLNQMVFPGRKPNYRQCPQCQLFVHVTCSVKCSLKVEQYRRLCQQCYLWFPELVSSQPLPSRSIVFSLLCSWTNPYKVVSNAEYMFPDSDAIPLVTRAEAQFRMKSKANQKQLTNSDKFSEFNLLDLTRELISDFDQKLTTQVALAKELFPVAGELTVDHHIDSDKAWKAIQFLNNLSVYFEVTELQSLCSTVNRYIRQHFELLSRTMMSHWEQLISESEAALNSSSLASKSVLGRYLLSSLDYLTSLLEFHKRHSAITSAASRLPENFRNFHDELFYYSPSRICEQWFHLLLDDSSSPPTKADSHSAGICVDYVEYLDRHSEDMDFKLLTCRYEIVTVLTSFDQFFEIINPLLTTTATSDYRNPFLRLKVKYEANVMKLKSEFEVNIQTENYVWISEFLGRQSRLLTNPDEDRIYEEAVKALTNKVRDRVAAVREGVQEYLEISDDNMKTVCEIATGYQKLISSERYVKNYLLKELRESLSADIADIQVQLLRIIYNYFHEADQTLEHCAFDECEVILFNTSTVIELFLGGLTEYYDLFLDEKWGNEPPTHLKIADVTSPLLQVESFFHALVNSYSVEIQKLIQSYRIVTTIPPIVIPAQHEISLDSSQWLSLSDLLAIRDAAPPIQREMESPWRLFEVFRVQKAFPSRLVETLSIAYNVNRRSFYQEQKTLFLEALKALMRQVIEIAGSNQLLVEESKNLQADVKKTLLTLPQEINTELSAVLRGLELQLRSRANLLQELRDDMSREQDIDKIFHSHVVRHYNAGEVEAVFESITALLKLQSIHLHQIQDYLMRENYVEILQMLPTWFNSFRQVFFVVNQAFVQNPVYHQKFLKMDRESKYLTTLLNNFQFLEAILTGVTNGIDCIVTDLLEMNPLDTSYFPNYEKYFPLLQVLFDIQESELFRYFSWNIRRLRPDNFPSPLNERVYNSFVNLIEAIEKYNQYFAQMFVKVEDLTTVLDEALWKDSVTWLDNFEKSETIYPLLLKTVSRAPKESSLGILQQEKVDKLLQDQLLLPYSQILDRVLEEKLRNQCIRTLEDFKILNNSEFEQSTQERLTQYFQRYVRSWELFASYFVYWKRHWNRHNRSQSLSTEILSFELERTSERLKNLYNTQLNMLARYLLTFVRENISLENANYQASIEDRFNHFFETFRHLEILLITVRPKGISKTLNDLFPDLIDFSHQIHHDILEEFKNAIVDRLFKRIEVSKLTDRQLVDVLLFSQFLYDNTSKRELPLISKFLFKLIGEFMIQMKRQIAKSRFTAIALLLNQNSYGQKLLEEQSVFDQLSRETFTQRLPAMTAATVKELLNPASKESVKGDELDYEKLEYLYSEFVKGSDRIITGAIASGDLYQYTQQLIQEVRALVVAKTRLRVETDLNKLVILLSCYWSLSNTEAFRFGSLKESTGHSRPILPVSSALLAIDPTDLVKPTPHQIIAIYRFLSLDVASKDYVSHLAQIPIGEGKSLVLAMTATILALFGQTVHCGCFSEFLAKRDYQRYLRFFTAFNVHEKIVYSSFHELAELYITEIAESLHVRKAIQSILQSSAKSVSKQASKAKSLVIQLTPSAPNKILLIDEVDAFFNPVSGLFDKQYPIMCKWRDPMISQFLLQVWREYSRLPNGLAKGKVSSFKENVKMLREYQQLLEVYPDWEPLLSQSVSSLCKELVDFPDRFDRVPRYPHPSRPNKIGYIDQDRISDSLHYGWLTIFSYLRLNSGNLTAIEKELFFPVYCGSVPFAAIPKQYKAIFGVSGTLDSSLFLPPLRDIIKNHYSIYKHTWIPSVYTGPNLLSFDEKTDLKIEIESSYFAGLAREIEERKKLSDNPLLVVFESKEKLGAYYSSSYGRGRLANSQVISEETSFFDRERILRQATAKKAVTLITKHCIRGLELMIFDDSILNPPMEGIQVLQTFLSSDPSEELQIRGCASRRGLKGSYFMVLLKEYMASSFDINEMEFETMNRGHEFFQTLKPKQTEVWLGKCEALLERIQQQVQESVMEAKFFSKLSFALQSSSKVRKREINRDVREYLLAALNFSGNSHEFGISYAYLK